MDSSILSLFKSPAFKPCPINCPADFPIHPTILSKFPPNTKIISVQRRGTSLGTITSKLTVQSPDTSFHHYFLKLTAADTGHLMIEGEFTSMTALYDSLPIFVPKPYAYGAFSVENTQVYFLKEEYIELEEILPEPEQFCSKLARLHRDSVSPTGKFGFEVVTCNGMTPQATKGWEGSWRVCFTRLLVHMLEKDRGLNGIWKH
jgi:protein-ribulosamine 3-kinase